MLMTPGVRKFALTAHVASSVGWLGAVAAFLVLSIVGVTSPKAETVRGSYIAMDLVGLYMIVPLSLAALLTGVIQGLGTQWGLFRYYWVITKLGLTIAATGLLLLHQFTAVAEAARRALGAKAGALPNVDSVGTQLIVDAAAAIALLLVTTTLSVYKPWGKTSYGRREEDQRIPTSGALAAPAPLPLGLRIFLAIVGVIVATILVVHLAGGGLHHH